jgi:hypothetical protein
MPEDRSDVFKVLLRTLDVLEAVVREENPLDAYEREEISKYQTRLIQIVKVTGRADIDMSQHDESKSARGDWVGGDKIEQRAGGDMKGVAAGRGASAHYVEARPSAIESMNDLKSGIEDLINEVSVSDLSPQEKAQLLNALLWWQENADNADEPPDAEEQLTPFKTATNWVKDRISELASSATGAVAGHWAVELVKQLF